MSVAKVIADSITEYGDRLTTLEVVMHRFVLAEFNTHRAFSRNSASSRAIPVDRQIAKVMLNPAIPVSWGKNQKGMQAEVELSAEEQDAAHKVWLDARTAAVEYAQKLLEIGVHKQITNRLLEPFMWHTAIVSASEWKNFEMQRCSALAQPEIQIVAYAIRDALEASKPILAEQGHWHLPYIAVSELSLSIEELKKISVARCARVSYLTHDGKRDISEDLKMYDRLFSANPPHMSPFEHVATPTPLEVMNKGNFEGWTQLRHIVFNK